MGLLLLVLLLGVGGTVAVMTHGAARRVAPTPERPPPSTRAVQNLRQRPTEASPPAPTEDPARWPKDFPGAVRPWTPAPIPSPQNRALSAHRLPLVSPSAESTEATLRSGGMILYQPTETDYPRGVPRAVWVHGDGDYLLGAADWLYTEGGASGGVTSDRLYEGAAIFDAMALIVLAAEGRQPNNRALFDRARAEQAAYDAKMKAINRKGFRDFKSLNLIAFVADLWEGAGLLLRGTWKGITQTFEGSHGRYADALALEFPWKPMDAEKFLHRAYLTTRATFGHAEVK